MNGISSINLQASTTLQTKSPEAPATKSSDYMTFLRMLTTQVQNQDPLNPMDSTDFSAQLATFSGVEQQTQTNSILSQLLSNATTPSINQYTGWIGREVLTSGLVNYTGAPISLLAQVATGATSANHVILDQSGREVSRVSIPATSGEVQWSGKSDTGDQISNGFYQFKVESLAGDSVISTEDAASYAEVTGIELSNQGIVLTLGCGAAVLANDVMGLRNGHS